jgi:hypothetical protein
MRRALTVFSLAACSALSALPAAAAERPFAYTQVSTVLSPGESQIEPWTTFRAGRGRYYSALDGRLGLSHGLTRGLELDLFWNFQSRSRDVVADELTGKLARQSESELTSASLRLAYQLSDARADLLGSAVDFEATVGPQQSKLAGRLIADRELGNWKAGANLGLECQLESVRDDSGSELDTTWRLEPTIAASYALPLGFSLGVELRAPLEVAGELESATLFGGPLLGYAARRFWLTLGVEPQLVAFAGQSRDSRLDLDEHERLEVRLLAGFLL